MQSTPSIEGNAPGIDRARGEQLQYAFALLSPADLASLVGVDDSAHLPFGAPGEQRPGFCKVRPCGLLPARRCVGLD